MAPSRSPNACSAMPSRACATASVGFSRTAARSSSIAASRSPVALEREAEIVAGLGVIRPQRDGRLQRRQRAFEIARPPPRRAEVVLRIEQDVALN